MKKILALACCFFLLTSAFSKLQAEFIEKENQINFYNNFVELRNWIFPVSSDLIAHPRYLAKLTIAIELLSDKDVPIIVTKAAHITDKISEFSSSATFEQFNSSKGIYQTKMILTKIISDAIKPYELKQVLISDIIIQ